jgi:excisionase family DNA binding protein
MYSAHIEVARRDDGWSTDAVLDALAPFHPSVGTSPRGWADAQVSLPAETLAQATAAACAAVSHAFAAEVVAAEVMTEAEFAAREGWTPVPELVSVTEAADMLGVSRQAILDRIARKTLPAEKVGREYVIARGAVR